MNQEEFLALLKTTGLEVAYKEWPAQETPPLPWLVYYFDQSNDLFADDHNYYKMGQWVLEHYFCIKDPSIDQKIQAVLESASLPYTNQETDANEEGVTMSVYLIQIGEKNG